MTTMSFPTQDIAQLGETQQSALQTYTSITDQDPVAAIPILQRAEWNVQIAITRFFEGEPSTDPVAEAQAAIPSPSTSYRQTSNLHFDDVVASVRPHPNTQRNPNAISRVSTQPGQGAQYETPLILSVLFLPFSLLYRVFATLFAPLGSLFPFIPRLFSRLFPPQRHRPSRRALPPADNARRFIREFSEEYGVNNLPFAEMGFNLALENAKRDFKFLLVVLLSPSHDDTSSWVRDILLSPQFSSFLVAHCNEVILWGGNVQDAEAYQVADTVQCTTFPFAGLVCCTANSGSTGMSTVMRASGLMPTTELVARISTAMTAQQGQLTAARMERQQAQASRNLRQEQDSAYERSLAQDRERARLKRQEAEAQAEQEKEALEQVQAEKRNTYALQQWRRWRAQSLASEPEKNGQQIIRISIRLPNGERIIRNFPAEAQLEEVYAFVECYDTLKEMDFTSEKPVLEPDESRFRHQYNFRLVSPMPRAIYSLVDGGSIGKCIGKGANLIVEPIGEDDDDDEYDENI